MLFTVAGIVLVVAAAIGGAGIGPAGFGAFLTIVGIVVLGPIAAQPGDGGVGRTDCTVPQDDGSPRADNAMRNPRRTAATASALMVGVAVVTLFTVFAASVKAAIDDTVSKQFGGDLVIASQNFSAAGLSPQMTTDIQALPEVAIATAQGVGAMTIDRRTSRSATSNPRSSRRCSTWASRKGRSPGSPTTRSGSLGRRPTTGISASARR